MADRLILVGRIAGAFGVKGELRIASYTEDPMALTRYRVLLREDGSKALTLTGGRPVKGGLVARAQEVPDRNVAEALRGLRLFVPREALPPPDEDEFYLADLIGLAAEALDGARLGTIKSVQDFGAGDLLEIQPESGASWWLPFTKEAVPEVRLADGKIIAVRPEETE
jgi:16S rRNA processing protein RimM